MARARAVASVSFYAALFSVAVAACFDTKLIPTEASRRSGEGGQGTPGAAGLAEGGDAGRSGPAEGGSADGGRSGPTKGGSANGGRSGPAQGGDAGDTSSSAGQPSAGGSAAISWLSLEGSTAPRSKSANAKLGISGAFYAYADGCADLSWDAGSRCASGTLCDPSNGQNWGIAVGFDLNNTGAQGTPPDTKLIWNPDDFGARGFAFRLSGSAPGLQLWVLNMAPQWQGQCSAMTCEIAGPPDGLAAAPLAGQLLFDHMVKDYWGGAGLYYPFDPGAVHALQFKLPAINVGALTFSFCVDALGVVR
jgi:hypothetical protein